jgi:hypothetical protein
MGLMENNKVKNKMKKLFLLFVALVGISFAVNAQSCEIKGADDGSTVMVTSHFIDGEKIVVVLGNDSEKTCANVTVKVTANGKEFEGYGKSCPGSTRIDITIGEPIKSYKVEKVSGTKCNSI